jgi:hypothetical protein
MYHVKYRDFFGKLVLCAGRSTFEDAQSEAEDHAHAGQREVAILIDLDTADVSMEVAAALSRRHSLPGTARPGCRDDGRTQTQAATLR